MDNTKDIKIQDKNTPMSDKNIGTVTFFEKDVSFTFLCKKTEKLSTAVYLVTNLLSDNEPMKWTLRKKVSDFMSFVISYKNVFESGQTEFLLNTKTRVFEIISLLEISSNAGLISSMNVSILKQEFSNLIETFQVSKPSQNHFSQVAIPETFFDISYDKNEKNIEQNPEQKQTQILGQNALKDKDIIPEKAVFKRNNRQSIIINLLKKKKEISIKDVTEIIRDCSEKTVQRELMALTIAGVLRKTGQRRWSRYSLSPEVVS